MIAKRKINEVDDIIRSGKKLKEDEGEKVTHIYENSGFSPEMSEWEGDTVDEKIDIDALLEKRGIILE